MHEANLAGEGGSRSSAGPRAGYALALLIGINMFNYHAVISRASR